MNKRQILISGAIIGTLGLAVLIIRRLTNSYSSITSAINSAMGNYFTISELCYSDTAKEKGIDNTPPQSVQVNLSLLIHHVLNPIRERYGKPIKVSSGYRCAALNTLLGGVSNSQHLTGQAADLVPTSGGTLSDIFRSAIVVGTFDQLILECSKKGTKWVHVSYSPSPRHQILYYNGNSYANIASNWQQYV